MVTRVTFVVPPQCYAYVRSTAQNKLELKQRQNNNNNFLIFCGVLLPSIGCTFHSRGNPSSDRSGRTTDGSGDGSSGMKSAASQELELFFGVDCYSASTHNFVVFVHFSKFCCSQIHNKGTLYGDIGKLLG